MKRPTISEAITLKDSDSAAEGERPISPGAENLSALIEELSSTRPEALRFVVALPRFHREDLLELMLHLAQTELLTDPELANRLVQRATLVATYYRGDDPDYPRSVLARAHCLSANGFRLSGRLDQAEDSLRTAATFLDISPGSQELDRAIYCQTLSLVRWERGFLDEALSVLRQSWILFDQCKAMPECTASSLLLALLHDEMGCTEGVFRAVGRLLGDPCAPSCPPWLNARAWLTFAAIASGNRQLALPALNEGVRFLGFVSDKLEQLRLWSLEGRARGSLGFFDEAEQLLEAVRRQHLGARRVIELTHASLDLLALRCAADRRPGIDDLVRDLETLGDQDSIAVDHASAALDRFVSWDAGEIDPWISSRRAATWYLQALRFAGIRPAPLAFA